MATKHGFPPDDRFPLIVSDYADQHELPSIGMAWDIAAICSRILKTSVLVVTASVIAILSMGNPIALFDYVTASLVDISPFQRDIGPQTPSIQSTAVQDLPPIPAGGPTRDEIAAAIKAAGQSQAESLQPPVDASSAETSSADASLKQFQAWAAEQDTRAQNVQSGQDAPAQVVEAVQDVQEQAAQNARAALDDEAAQNTSAVAPPMAKHRHARRAQNARAEVRRDARGQVRPPATPAADVRPPDRPAQNAQAPTLLQSLGFHD
jgi:hypothetical protein